MEKTYNNGEPACVSLIPVIAIAPSERDQVNEEPKLTC